MKNDIQSKISGALAGLCIGDALAMPVHWYIDRMALQRDYGYVLDYLAPHNPHPNSILWRSSYEAPNAKGEILHDQAQYWGERGVHYHQFLAAGENTLNVKICRLLVESLNNKGGYDANDFLNKYIAFMTTPNNHRDTYIEECHRNFFANYAIGIAPHKCGVTEKHIGGLVGIVPIVAFYANKPSKARENALAHLVLTHPGSKMETSASIIIDILIQVFGGKSLRDAIMALIAAQNNPFLGHPFIKLLNKPDQEIIGRRFSTACYVEDAVPAVIYLALKYHDDPEKALIVNTNLGGDNAGRGAVLGAILGAANGIRKFPDRWLSGLAEPLPNILSVT
ncbi:MAG: ADP-ribosylglycohydrolase family protein [Deltaproteobacteria bacterium]|nr:ADP-ribosylglycohydrolase family protein [Deltaproteobacteria bacterium]